MAEIWQVDVDDSQNQFFVSISVNRLASCLTDSPPVFYFDRIGSQKQKSPERPYGSEPNMLS